MFYGEGLCLIEWANLIEEILPEHYRQVTIEKDLEKGFDYRHGSRLRRGLQYENISFGQFRTGGQRRHRGG